MHPVVLIDQSFNILGFDTVDDIENETLPVFTIDFTLSSVKFHGEHRIKMVN